MEAAVVDGGGRHRGLLGGLECLESEMDLG